MIFMEVQLHNPITKQEHQNWTILQDPKYVQVLHNANICKIPCLAATAALKLGQYRGYS